MDILHVFFFHQLVNVYGLIGMIQWKNTKIFFS